MICASKTPEVSRQEAANASFSRRLAGECVVLLENDGTLPIRKGGKIALYGEGIRRTIKGGTGSGDVYSREVVSVERGFIEAGFEITTGAWLDRCDAKADAELAAYEAELAAEMAAAGGMSRIVAEINHPYLRKAPPLITQADVDASGTDTAVYVLTRNSGEGADRWNRRGDYLLFEEEIQNISFLAGRYDKLIVVMNIGAVTDVTELRAIEGVNALVMMGQLGNLGGNALCDVLTGETMPAGRLADTWAMHYADYPSSATFSHNDGDVSDEPYTEGIYVGYRYFDTAGQEVAYPFGYGKGYTDFDIAVQHVALEADGRTISAGVCVTNTGKTYAGREVVQLYVSAPAGALDKPAQVLCAYAKTKQLLPGETETLTLRFDLAAAASYSEKQSAWMLEGGRYLVRIGKHSRDTDCAAALDLPKTVVTEQLRPLCGCAGLKELVLPAPAHEDAPATLLALDPAAFTPKVIQYSPESEPLACKREGFLTAADVLEGRATVEEFVANLSVRELAELCVGAMRSENGSIVGNASDSAPGAAGDTCRNLEKARGLRALVTADGPAGLRLIPHFGMDEEGHFYTDPNSIPAGAEHRYQYCTALPIGWSLAQSWDDDLLEQAGDMVGEEMERFGIDLWLAPALNIHRNPLCGRNFEYYSEDPLISGRTAAAITRGVQRHPGKGTTIKHFAVNNQEDNRYFSNSIVSERALREVYLRGFEIAVKQSQPLSLMTSYNLLNGVHTANHRGLLRDVLRDEWGYTGFVMTDWFTSQDASPMTGKSPYYPISSSAGCVRAGNDVQMPGCSENVDDIVRAVEGGEAPQGYMPTLGDLQQCALRVVRVTLACVK